MVSLRVKTLSSTNKVDSRHKKVIGPLGRCLTTCWQSFLKNDFAYYTSSLIRDSAMLPENVDRSTRLNFINLCKYEKFFFYGLLRLIAQQIKMRTSCNFELRCDASYIIKQRVSFVMVLTTRSVTLEVECWRDSLFQLLIVHSNWSNILTLDAVWDT